MSHSPLTDRQTIRIFWRASLKYKKLAWLSLLFPLGAIIMGVITPLCIGKTLAALSQPNGEPFRYLILFVISAAVALICNRIGHPPTVELQARTMRDLQATALETLLKRSVGFHNNNIGGKLVSDAIDFPTGYGQIANATYMNLVPFALVMVVGTTIIFFESWVLGVCILAMTGIILTLGIRDSRRMTPLRHRRLKASKAVTGQLADTITNVQTVKTFAREDDEMHEHQKLAHTFMNVRIHDWYLMSVRGNKRIAALLTLQALFVLVTIIMVHRNPALLGIGIFAFSFTITLSNKLFDINMMLRNYEDGLLQASPITEIMQDTPEILDAKDAKKLVFEKGAIDFTNVTFRYQDGSNDQTVFSNLDLHIAPGEKVGLVGPSGGGKSTFTRLLLRFEDIESGQIAIDGQNIAEVTQKSLRQTISYVPQEPLLFHRSVSDNINYGNPSASSKLVVKAAKAAHADDFVEKLPQGYDTIVGERGVKLSGGQRQRVAIARAILKDSPILVLDEATSALDSESEVYIQDALWKLMKDRTAIVIAHRLSTIQKMDRIVVLEDGKITEQGSHAELLKNNGTYAKLWGHQSGGFIED